MNKIFKVLITILSCVICFGVATVFVACDNSSSNDDGKVSDHNPIIGTWIGDLPDFEYRTTGGVNVITNCKIYLEITNDKDWLNAGKCYRMDIYRRYLSLTPGEVVDARNSQSKYFNLSVSWSEIELSDNQYYYSDNRADAAGGSFDYNKKVKNTGYIFTLSGDTVTVTMADGSDDMYILNRTSMTVEEFQQLDVFHD